MKKFLTFALLPLFILCCLPQTSSAQIIGGIGGGNGFPFPGGGGLGNIDVGPWGPGNGSIPTPTSVTPVPDTNPVSAWIDFDLGQVVVSFNEEVGTVTVAVTDVMGRVISSCRCNTALEPEVWLSAPAAKGCYRLVITGKEGGCTTDFEFL